VNCCAVTDAVLVPVYAGCRALRALRLDFCANITSSGLAPLVRLPRLEELSLSYCSEISVGAARVFAACGWLVSLELVKTRIDDAALDLIVGGEAARGGRLRSINLLQCSSVSALAVREAHEACHQLTIVSDHSSTPARVA
jgi:hypothetical protein